MNKDETNYQRRVEREIAVFEAQETLHNHGPAFHHYTSTVVAPLLASVFGRSNVHEVYAESLAGAVVRSGLNCVYSLGCGDAAQELEVLRAADRLGLPPFRIVGLELAPTVAQRANDAAARLGLQDRMKVVVHDLNDGLPEHGDVAGVMAHHVLHHIVALEDIFDTVEDRLHPEGVFVTFDMIGRNGHMRWPEVRPVMRLLWDMLPKEKRFDHVFRTPNVFYQDWDCAIEGFEGVRAQDILPLMAERFAISRFAAWGGLADVFVSPRFCSNFDPQVAADRAFMDSVSSLEAALLERRQTTPASMAAEFRSRRGGFTADAANEARIRRALRLPEESFEPILAAGFSSPWPAQAATTTCILEPAFTYRFGADEEIAACLHGGWSEIERHGVYGLLDEQFLSLCTTRSVNSVTLHGWNPLPSERPQHLQASAEDCDVYVGPLENGAQFELVLKSRAPKTTWNIKTNSGTYRLPQHDGGEDLRPLAWLLKAIEIGKPGQ